MKESRLNPLPSPSEIKKSGMPLGSRAGFSMCVHKKRALLFGGVVDMEVEGDSMMSAFLNEFYGFQLDNHRWYRYPLELREGKSTKEKVKKSSEQRPNSLDYEIINATETEESATTGKDVSLECQEQEVDTESSINDLSQNMASVIVDDGGLSAPSDEGKAEGSKAQSNFFSFQKQL